MYKKYPKKVEYFSRRYVYMLMTPVFTHAFPPCIIQHRLGCLNMPSFWMALSLIMSKASSISVYDLTVSSYLKVTYI